MKKYNNNISNYVDSEFLEEETSKIGEELSFLPEEETEANFCTLESIKPTDEDFTVILAIENETCYDERADTSWHIKHKLNSIHEK